MRLPKLEISELTAAQKVVFDQIQRGPRSTGGRQIGLIGPFGVWVRAPLVGGAVQALGSAVRFEATLANNVKEVAICTVGVFHQSRFEFAAHRKLAIEASVDAAALESLRAGGDPGFTGDEAIAYRVAQQLLHEHRIDRALYGEAVASLGEEALIELVTTIGYYCLVSLTLNAFEIPLEDGMDDPFPHT